MTCFNQRSGNESIVVRVGKPRDGRVGSDETEIPVKQINEKQGEV